jgi:hypothetical protein
MRKDDLFKVVFDPGADKREKGIPRQITGRTPLLYSRGPLRAKAASDTGSVLLDPSTCAKRKDGRISETQLV